MNTNAAIPFLGRIPTVPGGLSSDYPNCLQMLCGEYSGFMNPLARNRLDKELQVIHQLGLESFFLAMVDIYHFAKSRGHVILLEGPAASSFVLHCLGLTPINPIEHGLLFERFLNPGQAFAPSRRFFISKGGQEEVVHFARNTFGLSGDDPMGERPWRACSQRWHSPLAGTSDLATIDIVEHLGLGLIKQAVDLIKKNMGKETVPDLLPTDDQEVLAVFCRGETFSIQPFESVMARSLLRMVKPVTIGDLAKVWSLSQPAQVQNGVSLAFKESMLREDQVREWHPVVKNILGYTHGILLFQEQVMELAFFVGGLPFTEGYELLNAVWRFDQTKVSAFQEKFFAEAEDKHMDMAMVKETFELITHQGRYATCKANAMTSAAIAYQIAYLKSKHEQVFMSVVRNSEKF